MKSHGTNPLTKQHGAMMTKPVLDKTKGATIAGGRPPLYFIQNGHGFNRGGDYLGECNEQGELMPDAGQPDLDKIPQPDGEPDQTGGAENDTGDNDKQDVQQGESGEAAQEGQEPSAADTATENSADTSAQAESTKQPEPAPSKAEPAEPFKGVQIKTLLKKAEDAGLDVEPGIQRDELIKKLVAANVK